MELTDCEETRESILAFACQVAFRDLVYYILDTPPRCAILVSLD
jgi:hypothetical protein